MFIKQLSIFVENKQGKLSEILNKLSGAGINMRAISIADTQDFGVLRIIVKDPEKARAFLSESNVIVTINHVIGVELSDRPGALSEVIDKLSAGGVNIEYMYAFVTPGNSESAYLVLRARDNRKAEKILSDAGIPMLSEEQIEKI